MANNKAFKSKNRISNNLRNITFLTLFAFVFSTSSFYTFSLIFSYVNTALTSRHPTSIPWIKNQMRCEDSGRHWEDNQCWDYEHSSNF